MDLVRLRWQSHSHIFEINLFEIFFISSRSRLLHLMAFNLLSLSFDRNWNGKKAKHSNNKLIFINVICFTSVIKMPLVKCVTCFYSAAFDVCSDQICNIKKSGLKDVCAPLSLEILLKIYLLAAFFPCRSCYSLLAVTVCLVTVFFLSRFFSAIQVYLAFVYF